MIETPTRPSPAPDNWLSIHIAHPGPGRAVPGDPNCAYFWAGRYHLHYIYLSDDGYAFAHVSSSDLVHWKWHRTTLTPSTTGHGMWSGTGFITREGRPAMIYHGAGPGNYFGYGIGNNFVSVALDDELETWSIPRQVAPVTSSGQDSELISPWDPDAWLEGDTYFAIFGGYPGSGKHPTLHRSHDLEKWEYVGPFMTEDLPGVGQDEDVSCPNFFAIGNEHMLLCISHSKGCRYYLGRWDGVAFTPTRHGRMNWSFGDLHGQGPLRFFAPESLLTPDGRRVMWAWCVSTLLEQTGVQSLPREIALSDAGELMISPLSELELLRTSERTYHCVAPGFEAECPASAFEIQLTAIASDAAKFGIDLCSPDGSEEAVQLRVDTLAGELSIGSVAAPLPRPADGKYVIRAFVDLNMVEIFANGRQAIAATAPPSFRSGRVRVVAHSHVSIESMTTWSLDSIYESVPAELGRRD